MPNKVLKIQFEKLKSLSSHLGLYLNISVPGSLFLRLSSLVVAADKSKAERQKAKGTKSQWQSSEIQFCCARLRCISI